MSRAHVIGLMPWCLALITGCEAGEGVALGEPRTVSAATGTGTAPMFTVSAAGREAVAWVSAPDGGIDGRVYVSVDDGPPAQLSDPLGPIEAHGESPPKLVFGPDGALNTIYVVGKVIPGRRFPAGALRFARSVDGGEKWSDPVTVTDDSVFGSHNFHALHAGDDGTLYVSWLDGRDGKSAAYLARSTDGGLTWTANLRVSTDEACPCCRTGIVTAPDGTLYLAWRTVLPGNVRDVVVARSTDRGETWGKAIRVNADDWVFDGCPHAGPSLQVDPAGAVHVAWWTGKKGSAGVFYARSNDGAQSFGSPVPIAVAAFSRPAHVQLALGEGGLVAAAWDDGIGETPQVLLRVSRDGGTTFAEAVEISAKEDVAGYPVVALRGKEITMAWSQRTRDDVAREESAKPDPRNSASLPALRPVGAAQVIVRRGVIN